MPGCSRRAACLVLALVALPAAADWKDDYARGLVAANEGRWAEVARLMDSAIAGNATPAARVRLYGQRYEVYAPQHYAGLAALRREDCATALRFWSQPANQGFIGGQPRLASVQEQGRSECATKLASQTPAPVVERPPPVVVQTPPAPPPRTPPSTPPQVPPPRVEPRAPSETRAPLSIASLTLQPMLGAYLNGRYSEVLRLSASANPEQPRLRWHVQTLRAAAAYSLAQLGEGPADAQTTARQAVAEARRIDPALRPDPGFYSPRFIRFFEGR